MDSFERLIDRATPIRPTLTGGEVHARLRNEPNLQVLAVVDADARPIGLVERDVLVRMAAEHGPALYAGGPASSLMTPDPLIVEVGTPVGEVCREVLARSASAPVRGFIVTRQGRYLGLGTVVSLLEAANAAAGRQATEAATLAERLARAEAAAKAAAHAQGRFLDLVSQETRTPLNGILAMAELLNRQPLAGDGAAYVRTILESGESLMRLLADAADLSRADREGLELAPESVPLRDLMDEVQAHWLPRAAGDGVGLSITYRGDPGLAAELDAVRLKQVFGSLIGNALRLTRQGGLEAGLDATHEDGRVRLRGFVRDSGPGLDPSRIATVFDPFAQERGGPSDRAGLELAMCRRILEAMGGRIWAENNPGAGAVFRFEFDGRFRESSAAKAAAEQSRTAPALKGHVLIVDDNATNRMVAQTLIEMFGCTAETAEDGVEAVEAVARTRFDAILMDIRMPRMDGVAATRAIRALPGPERSIPIIALTANADPDDARRYLASGMASVVEKPIKSERLLGAMLEVLATGAARPAVAAA